MALHPDKYPYYYQGLGYVYDETNTCIYPELVAIRMGVEKGQAKADAGEYIGEKTFSFKMAHSVTLEFASLSPELMTYLLGATLYDSAVAPLAAKTVTDELITRVANTVTLSADPGGNYNFLLIGKTYGDIFAYSAAPGLAEYSRALAVLTVDVLEPEQYFRAVYETDEVGGTHKIVWVDGSIIPAPIHMHTILNYKTGKDAQAIGKMCIEFAAADWGGALDGVLDAPHTTPSGNLAVTFKLNRANGFVAKPFFPDVT